MDYVTKVKIEKGNTKIDAVKSEFNSAAVLQDTIANVEINYGENAIIAGSTPTTIACEVQPYAAMIIDYLPSVGGRNGRNRFQLGFKDQFVKVVGSAYSALTLNECDLIKLAMYSEALYLVIAEVDRALQTYDKFDKVNKAFGQFLVESMGFSWASLSQDRQKWIDARNTLAHIVNAKFYLGKSKRLERHLTLASKVFATDTNRKTQLIIFRPLEYTSLWSTTSWEVGIGTFNALGSGSNSKNVSLILLNNLINSVRDASMSAWYDDVAPYLHHLYGDSDTDLYKISDYAPMSDFGAVYDCGILNLIRNMRLLQQVYSDGARSAADNYIFITENNSGHICQGGWVPGSGYTNAVEFMVGSADAIVGTNDSLDIIHESGFNIDEFPGNEEDMYSGLFGRFTQNALSSGMTLVPGVIEYTPTTLFYCARLAYTDIASEGSLTGSIKVYNYHGVLSGGPRNLDVDTLVGGANIYQDALRRAQFGVLPYQHVLRYDSGTGTVSKVDTYLDIDNLFYVGRETWIQFVSAELYEDAQFAVPSFTGRK